MDLDQFIAQRRGRDFEYFVHDCVHFAAEWVVARTGEDPLAPIRSDVLQAASLLAAMRFVRACGGFLRAGEQLLGPSLPGLTAQRSDVVLMRSGRREGRVSGLAFGVCTGANLIGPGVFDLEFLPVTEAVAAWRLPVE